MKFVYDSEDLILFYYVKSEQFYYLANYLNVCKFIVECPIKDTVDAGPLPSTDENYEIFSERTNSDEVAETVTGDYDFDENQRIEFDVFYEYIKNGKMIIENICSVSKESGQI